MIRRPAVAGRFYPAEQAALRNELRDMTHGKKPPAEPRGLALMVPHAGYVYSGRVAAATYTSVRLPSRVVVLCPNHTGQGEPIAVMDRGSWELPLGMAPIDNPLATAILARCASARVDEEAHRAEHSLVVQIPFLQFLVEDLRFVPICVGTMRLTLLLELGRAVGDAIRADGGEVLLVISSDMSHYVPVEEAERQDRKALDRVLALDPEGLHSVVLREEISMCGVAPAVAGLEAARQLGARQGRLVTYATSGDKNGDYQSVVGYAGVAVT
ncbi:MAG TPA: AmmeMemoRadiSam system protein B [Candidatus Polarisedimenticolia bacterium]|nr:AmmeMemoRadiSam system protein B [Candidatus Polarisedimenticolia bacterium]